MKRPEMLNQSKSSLWNSVFVIICALLFVLLFFSLWFSRVFFVVQVSGSSMNDTLYGGERTGAEYIGGDLLYADRTAQPQRGDIVIIDVSDYGIFDEDTIIKRLIAVEGDAVKCEDGIVYLKKEGEDEFQELDEPYVKGAHSTPSFREVTVGEGEIFVLGDNRRSSYDSEEVGCLKRSDVLGVVPEWAVEHKGLIKFLEHLRSPFGS